MNFMNNDLILKRKLQALLPQQRGGCWSIDSPIGKLFSLIASIPEPPPSVCFYCGARINNEHYPSCTRLK